MGNQNWAQHEKTQFNEGEQCVTAKKEPGENDWKYYSDACTSNNFRPLCVSNGRQSCMYLQIRHKTLYSTAR